MHTATADYTLFHPEAPVPTRCHHLLFIGLVATISACVLLTIAVSIGLIALACIKLQYTHKFCR